MKEVKICGNLNCYLALLISFLGLQRWMSVTRKRLNVISFKLTVLVLHSVVWSSSDINSNETQLGWICNGFCGVRVLLEVTTRNWSTFFICLNISRLVWICVHGKFVDSLCFWCSFLNPSQRLLQELWLRSRVTSTRKSVPKMAANGTELLFEKAPGLAIFRFSDALRV